MNMNCVISQPGIASEVDRPDRFVPGVHLNHAARAGKPVKDLFLLGFSSNQKQKLGRGGGGSLLSLGFAGGLQRKVKILVKRLNLFGHSSVGRRERTTPAACNAKNCSDNWRSWLYCFSLRSGSAASRISRTGARQSGSTNPRRGVPAAKLSRSPHRAARGGCPFNESGAASVIGR